MGPGFRRGDTLGPDRMNASARSPLGMGSIARFRKRRGERRSPYETSAVPAGHGVHRSFSSAGDRRSRLRRERRREISAGHGVLRLFFEAGAPLLDRHALGEIAGLVDVRALG